MKSLYSIIAAALVLFMAQNGLQAQSAFNEARTGTLAVRLDGGSAWAFGSAFDKPGSTKAKEIQPFAGAGLLFNFTPRFRAGLDYSFSRLIREQTGDLVTLPDGSAEGEVYKDLKTHLHTAALTGEFNLLGGKRLGLYLGTGAGCLIGDGNTYTIGIKNQLLPGGAGNTVHVTGHNEGHRYYAPFVPVTLSLEFAFLPQVSLSLGGGYRFVFAGSDGYAPKGQAYAALGLRFNLSE